LTVSCRLIRGPSTGVLNCADYELDSETNSIALTFTEADYKGGKLTPGRYAFVYDVTAGSEAVTELFGFMMVLFDPCNNYDMTVTTPTFTN